MFGAKIRIEKQEFGAISFEDGRGLMLIRVRELKEKIEIIKYESSGQSKEHTLEGRDFSTEMPALNTSLEAMWHGLWKEFEEEKAIRLVELRKRLIVLNGIYKDIEDKKNYALEIKIFERHLNNLVEILQSN
jgi:hypothetical protein